MHLLHRLLNLFQHEEDSVTFELCRCFHVEIHTNAFVRTLRAQGTIDIQFLKPLSSIQTF